ncbi:hypothetical protein [Streptomyces sp. NPDC048191]|uniref:hypothetical protein n=1 Tax=Streptomyces sp. NPDC048191 TaxID=3155484 RepID=UPI0033D64E1F
MKSGLRIGVMAFAAFTMAGANMSTAHAQETLNGSDGPIVVFGSNNIVAGRDAVVGSGQGGVVTEPGAGTAVRRKLGEFVTLPGSGLRATATVTCDPGWVVTGGGFDPQSDSNFRVISSQPIGADASGANPTGWQIVFTHEVSDIATAARAVALCVQA